MKVINPHSDFRRLGDPPAAAWIDGLALWFLVSGPVAGVVRLQADREMPLTKSNDDIGLESKHH